MRHPLKIIILVFLLTACATTPISNRPALILIPEWQEIQFGKQAYKKALKDHFHLSGVEGGILLLQAPFR